MHCTGCSMLIEGELGDIGVEAVSNYIDGHVDVVFDEKRISENRIHEVISKLGYEVVKTT